MDNGLSLISIVVMVLLLVVLIGLAFYLITRAESRRTSALRSHFNGRVRGSVFTFHVRGRTCYLKRQRFGCFLEIDLPKSPGAFQAVDRSVQLSSLPPLGKIYDQRQVGDKPIELFALTREMMYRVSANPQLPSLLSLLFGTPGLQGGYLAVGMSQHPFQPRPQITFCYTSALLYHSPQLLDQIVNSLLDVFDQRSP